MTVNQKPTEFQKSLGTINYQISELIRDHINEESISQELYFYRLTELDQALELWRDALDQFAIQADDHYSEDEESCEHCDATPAFPHKGQTLCFTCQDPDQKDPF